VTILRFLYGSPCPCLSKWFYDTSIGVATRAARCGSFAGKAFSPFGCSLWMNAVGMMIYVIRAT
jgi:hypothetical protein